MSFSFTLHGSAGDGMPSNSPEEIAAVQELAKATIAKARELNLSASLSSLSPPDWFPPQGELSTYTEATA